MLWEVQISYIIGVKMTGLLIDIQLTDLELQMFSGLKSPPKLCTRLYYRLNSVLYSHTVHQIYLFTRNENMNFYLTRTHTDTVFLLQPTNLQLNIIIKIQKNRCIEFE